MSVVLSISIEGLLSIWSGPSSWLNNIAHSKMQILKLGTLSLHDCANAQHQSLAYSNSRQLARGLRHSFRPIKCQGRDPWPSCISGMACVTRERQKQKLPKIYLDLIKSLLTFVIPNKQNIYLHQPWEKLAISPYISNESPEISELPL